jgi:GT2 family glycosyltransferase
MTLVSSYARISIVIPTYNGEAYLEKCLASILGQTHPPMEILVVDNASTDASVSLIQKVAPAAKILRQSRNLGFAGAANAGIRHARGDWIAILNNDTEVSATWLAECVLAIGRHPDAAFIACRILDFAKRGLVFSAGDCILRACIGYRRGQELPDCARYHEEIKIFSACGAAALYCKSVLEESGGFEDIFFAYLEDVDLGLRLQAAGYCGYYAPQAVVYHYGAATSGGEFSPLAVRLRTRNSFLLLVKGIPVSIFWRCLPMIVAVQASWFARVMLKFKGLSYMRGIIGAFRFLPAMLRRRKKMHRHWRRSASVLWQSILRSEALAREDILAASNSHVSLFLKLYFRLF